MPRLHNIPPNSSTSKLKIGFVLDDSLDKPDGVQQYILTLGAWLRAEGHDVHYLVSSTVRQDVPNIHVLGRNVGVRFNGNRMSMPLPASRRQIRRLLDKERFDVLHVQMPYSPLLAGRVLLSAPATTRLIGTFHIVPHSRLVRLASRLLALWCRRSQRRLDTVVSVSTAAQDFARQTFGVISDVLPNVIELPRFRDATAFYRADGAEKQILFLGRLVPRKGCILLLQAITVLRSRSDTPPFRVMICGKGPLDAALKQYVRDHGLNDIVQFAGFVSEDEKPHYLASADIAVFPSTGGESFGIVLLEAMASGHAAVIAGDNAGYRSVLARCPDEVLFDPTDTNLLADMLAGLLHDDARRQRIAAWQQDYTTGFDVAVIGRRLMKYYRGLADGA